MPSAKKIGRNDICPCGSGRKYKFCCFAKDSAPGGPKINIFDNNQSRPSSSQLQVCKDAFLVAYPDHKIIDISDTLNPLNYSVFQKTNYDKRIIMLAEKQDNNKEVFVKRLAEEADAMVLYRGSYRVFQFPEFRKCFDSICDMIDTRLAGKLDQ